METTSSVPAGSSALSVLVPPGEAPGQRRTLMTAVNVMLVLDAVSADPRGVTAKAVARRLGHSLSSAYYVLQSLTSLGFVEPSHGLYTLGPKIAQLFEAYVASWTLPRRLEPTLVELRDLGRARAYAAAWNNSDLEVTLVCGRRGATEMQDVSAGFRGAAHALAVGKVLLAATHPLRWPLYLRGRDFTRYTQDTITGHARLQEELAEVRRSGIAWDVEEYVENVCCVAAPIRDTAGRVYASIGVSVTARRFRAEREKLRAAVQTVAASASRLYEPLDPLGRLTGTRYAGQPSRVA